MTHVPATCVPYMCHKLRATALNMQCTHIKLYVAVNAVQWVVVCSAVLCSAVLCSAVRYSAVQCSKVVLSVLVGRAVLRSVFMVWVALRGMLYSVGMFSSVVMCCAL